MSIVNPRDLLLKQLAELLWIERTLFFEVLPKVHDDAHAPALHRHPLAAVWARAASGIVVSSREGRTYAGGLVF